LHGIWATPPFLHTQRAHRVPDDLAARGARVVVLVRHEEYDPVDLGYRNLAVPVP